MQNTKFKNILEITAVIIFFAVFVLCLSKPIVDPDVFWHLKTGEWIWQNKTLPDKDPFSFTVPPSSYDTSVRASFILKQYWLAQLMMYGAYQIGGFYGIIAFRCLIYLGIGLILYYWLRKKEISRLSALILIMPSVYFSVFWLGERPNNLSFLFAVIVVYLLEDMKGGGKARNYVFLPLVMLLWANMHGGFILGDAIITIYMAAEIIRLMIARGKRDATYETQTLGTSLTLVIVCLVSILSSIINPNTYKAVPTMLELEGTYYSASIMEMASPLKYAELNDYRYIIIIAVIALIFLLMIKQLRLNTALLIFFLVGLALTRVRYMPFLVFIATPFIPHVWKEFFNGLSEKTKKLFALFDNRPMLFYLIRIFVIAVFVIFLFVSQMELTIYRAPVIHQFFPKGAVNFIKAEKPEPEIFNYYEWGGYLIWSLYPDYKVFMDGRGLFQSVFLTYNKALSGSAVDVEGGPRWKAILDAYRVKAVLVPGANTLSGLGGQFMRIILRLVEDNQWSLVFIDREALLFIKDTEKNKEIIRKYSKPKIVAYGKALEQAEFYRANNPDDWKAYAALGEINLCMGKPAAALLNFEYALKLDPSLKSRGFGRLIEELRAGRENRKLLDDVFR